jgi:hypothetical protein
LYSWSFEKKANSWLVFTIFPQPDSKFDVHGHDFKLLPFGSGRRSCPGKNLALAVVNYALAVMLQCCHWTLPLSTEPEDLDMSEKFGLGVAKAEELKAIATPRLPAAVIYSSSDSEKNTAENRF